MSIERFIYIAIAALSLSTMLYIPKDKIRKALTSFVAFQATTWFVSIMLAQRGMIAYPVREFVKATNVNFIPQFIFYPTNFMWFILLFPEKKNILIKITHYLIFVSIMQWFIYFSAKYTDMAEFNSSAGISLILKGYMRNFIQFLVCHLYIIWFYKKEEST